ncbi:MAG: hypothetical protein BWY57_01223 [Betaproteobacteria bacterium ADurb.Bin341]|nr:MAG: hypothetical protein BWY57_01223 [Betaproteobacteria bacterium ADurb.Bin341]
MSSSGTSNVGINEALLNLASLRLQSNLAAMHQAKALNAGDFSSSFALCLAQFRTQTLGLMTGSPFAMDQADDPNSLGALLASLNASSTSQVSPTAHTSLVNGLSATGRNTALFDPESAYRMMSLINNNDVLYKAQFSELSRMKAQLIEMQQAGNNLAHIDASTDREQISSQLQRFTDQYNDWVRGFDDAMQPGGLLAGTQAAQVARYELRQSIQNPFHGASEGLNGLRDLGLAIDPESKRAHFDAAKLDSALSRNRPGVIKALQQFGTHFARSAELLVSEGNFIPNRLNNLSHVIDYFADNKTALQAEFGLGDAPKPSGPVAQALAAYQRMYS